MIQTYRSGIELRDLYMKSVAIDCRTFRIPTTLQDCIVVKIDTIPPLFYIQGYGAFIMAKYLKLIDLFDKYVTFGAEPMYGYHQPVNVYENGVCIGATRMTTVKAYRKRNKNNNFKINVLSEVEFDDLKKSLCNNAT